MTCYCNSSSCTCGGVEYKPLSSHEAQDKQSEWVRKRDDKFREEFIAKYGREPIRARR